MKDKKKSGRTFPDLISENPITTICILIGIAVITLIIVFSGKHIKIGSFEINNTKNVVKDTIVRTEIIYKTVHDTVIIEKRFSEKKKHNSTPKKKISIKDKETEINVHNQPANINTGTNNGVIGNNSTINNFGDKPLVLTEKRKENLIGLLDTAISKVPKDLKPMIFVSGIMGNKRSLSLANEIKIFLEKRKYTVNPSVGVFTSGESLNKIVISSNNNLISIDVDMY